MVEFAYEQVVDYKLNYIYNVITVEARTASMLKGTNIMKEINISKNITDLRKKKGITQEQLAVARHFGKFCVKRNPNR